MGSTFKYAPMFQLGEDTTQYYKIPGSEKLVKTIKLADGKTILEVSPEALTLVAQQSFHDCQFMLRRAHNEQVAAILNDPEASENDKYVALQFLRNAETSVKGVLPFCQDTGTAIIHGEKGQGVWTDFEDEEALSLGVFNTYTQENLRYSQNAPLNMYDEVNTKCNLPAQIDIEAVRGAEYRFIMVAKGGGSANKTYFYPMTKATIQNEGTLLPFLVEKMRSLGTAACPPYHIAFVIGGTSAEKNLLTVKLASIKYYDALPTTGDETGRAFRDIDLELPDRHGCQLLGRPQHQEQDQCGRRLDRADGHQPFRADSGGIPPSRRGSQGDCHRPRQGNRFRARRTDQVSCGYPGQPERYDHRGPRHRARQAESASGRR